MSLFDRYEPYPELHCPVCDRALHEWQGADGPCGQFVWRQGVEAPIAQDVEKEFRLSAAQRERVRLPSSFSIYARCCSDRFMVAATGYAGYGPWDRTELETVETLEREELTREEYEAKCAWLTGEAKDTAGVAAQPEAESEPVLELSEPFDPEPETQQDLREAFGSSMRRVYGAQALLALATLGSSLARALGPEAEAFASVLGPICLATMFAAIMVGTWYARCPGCGYFAVLRIGGGRPTCCVRCRALLSDGE